MIGSYTVGRTSSDFLTLDSAFRKLEKEGIKGNVILFVRSGNYNQQVTFKKVQGAGTKGNIKVIKEPADSGDAIFYQSIKDTSWEYILGIQSGHISFKNLTFKAHQSVKNKASTVLCFDSIQTLILTDCKLLGDDNPVNTTQNSVIEIKKTSVISYFELNNCDVFGGYIGVNIDQYGYYNIDTLLIRNNRFKDNLFRSIYTSYVSKLIIEGNHIESGSQSQEYIGIDLSHGQDSAIIHSNEINLLKFGQGIRIVSADYIELFNNIVFALEDNSYGSLGGILISSDSTFLIWHNSIFLFRRNSSCFGISVIRYDSSNIAEIYNNNFCVQGDGLSMSINGKLGSKFHSNFNNFFCGGQAPFKVNGASTRYTLSEMHKLGLEINSKIVDSRCYPWLNGRTHNHLLNSSGKAGLRLTADIDGNKRDNPPDIGANEFNILTSDIGVLAISADSISKCGSNNEYINIVIYNYGSMDVDSFDLSVIVSNETGNSDTLKITVNDTLSSLDTMHFQAGPFPIHFGSYKIVGRTFLLNDQDSLNDKISYQYSSFNESNILQILNDTICEGQSAYLRYPNSLDKVAWYSDLNANQPLDTGIFLRVDGLTQSRKYYYEVEEFARRTIGLDTPTTNTGYLDTFGRSGLFFEVYETLYIDSVTVYPFGTGSIKVRIVGVSNTFAFETNSIGISGNGSTPNAIPIKTWISPGRYYIVGPVKGIEKLRRETPGHVNPNFPFFSKYRKMTITSGMLNIGKVSESYYYFYDWILRDMLCTSHRDSANVVVNASPQIELGNDTTVCSDSSKYVLLDAKNHGAKHYWSTNETTPQIKVSKNGTYSVTVVDSISCQSSDVIRVDFKPAPSKIQIHDTFICTNDFIAYQALFPQTLNLYAGKDTIYSNSLDINDYGTYTILGQDTNKCWLRDTFSVIQLLSPEPVLPNDTGFCLHDSIHLTLFGHLGNTTNTWQDTLVSDSFHINQPSNIVLAILDKSNGCLTYDSIRIYYTPSPEPMLGPDIEFCSNDSFTKELKTNSMVRYLWDDGSTNSTRLINNEGVYFVTVLDSFGCSGSDTVTVKKNDVKIVDLGSDSSYCSNKRFSRLINLKDQYKYFLWDNGSKLSYRILNSNGKYWVRTEDENGCFDSDTIVIDTLPPPSLNLPSQIVLNPASKVDTTLFIESQYKSYLWSNGETNSSILVKDTGTYWVKVTDQNNCINYDTTHVRFWNLTSSKDNIIWHIEIYPNPSSNLLKVENPTSEKLAFTIYSSLGKMVTSGSLHNELSNIDISSFSEGLYLIQIDSREYNSYYMWFNVLR